MQSGTAIVNHREQCGASDGDGSVVIERGIGGGLQNIFTENCDACLEQGVAHGGGVCVKGDRFAVVVDDDRFC